jgi:hypothetical protein
LFFFSSGDKCACAFNGDLCSFNAPSNILRSAVSYAAITKRFSYGTDILLNLLMSKTLLIYPNARFTVYYQLSCWDFHPYAPPSSSTLLIYIHNCLSCSVYSYVGAYMLLSQCTVFLSSSYFSVLYSCAMCLFISLASLLFSCSFDFYYSVIVRGVPAYFFSAAIAAAWALCCAIATCLFRMSSSFSICSGSSVYLSFP